LNYQTLRNSSLGFLRQQRNPAQKPRIEFVNLATIHHGREFGTEIGHSLQAVARHLYPQSPEFL
jgi:hypothetical protein